MIDHTNPEPYAGWYLADEGIMDGDELEAHFEGQEFQ